MGKSFIELVTEDLQKDITHKTEAVARRHGVPDFAAYTEQCGVILGLRTALHIIEDRAKKYREDNDE